MRALVVYESMVGNTEAAARAVAAGLADELQVELLEVSHAPATIKEAVDLLVVGEPTPAFSMSRPSTREQAFDQGATRDEPNIGLHEWLAGSARARPVETVAASTLASLARAGSRDLRPRRRRRSCAPWVTSPPAGRASGWRTPRVPSWLASSSKRPAGAVSSPETCSHAHREHRPPPLTDQPVPRG
jgi:hypothetical protein